MNREQFLQYVRTYIEADPEAAPHVARYVQAGLNAALTQAYERAADMECALAALAAKRYKGADALVLDKLRKWEGKTALRWDWLTTPNVRSQATDAALSRQVACTDGLGVAVPSAPTFENGKD